jgi:hypothetical protein
MAGPAFFSTPVNIALNADWVVAFQLTAGGVPVDITGSVMRMQIRKHENDHEALVSLTSENNDGIEITDAVNGTVTITLARDRMRYLAAPGDDGTEYVGDLVRLRPDGEQERWWDMSPVTVYQGSTRP